MYTVLTFFHDFTKNFLDMASTSSLNPEDNFICSICLDVFTNPVMIPCGPNFRLDCTYLTPLGEQECCITLSSA